MQNSAVYSCKIFIRLCVIREFYVNLQHQNINIMAPKRTSKKSTKREQLPRKKIKYIKGCQELVKDPFNLK